MEPIRRSAHPRPDWVRPVWQTLNGTWQFRFDWKNEGKRQRWYLEPRFDLEIQVPFACQAELSGIREKRMMAETAVREAARQYVALLSETDDLYMQARSAAI